MLSLIPYIGGKHRLAKHIVPYLHATGADTLVDVFGGSAAVLLNAGFNKRIYNDASADLVCLFRVLADVEMRRQLLRVLRWTPPNRRYFMDVKESFVREGFTHASAGSAVERARRTFFQHMFAFGGKGRNGGFSVSTKDRFGVKEVSRYNNTLRRLAKIGDFFRHTMIENLDFQDCVAMYGVRSNAVLFCDPPYVGTEHYYTVCWGETHHAILASLLTSAKASVVCTYYDCDVVRKLYPQSLWEWRRVVATKNCQFRGGQKPKTEELILVKKGYP